MKIDVLASGSSGNCFRISDGYSTLLLECGIPFKEIKKKLKFKTSQLDGVLVTHEHKDHCKSVADFVDAGIEVVMSEGTADALGLPKGRLTVVAPLEKVMVGDWLVMPFDVEHDAKEPLGYLLLSANTGEKLLFFMDTGYVEHLFKGITHFIGECNYSSDMGKALTDAGLINLDYRARAERIIQSHMGLATLSQYLEAMDKSKLQEIHLVHLSDENSDAKIVADTIKGITGLEVYTY